MAVVITALLVFVGAAITGLVIHNHRAAEREAIAAVASARTNARLHATRYIGLGLYRHAIVVPALYVPEIQGINPMGCPDGFQHAWEDYVAAWARQLDPVHQRRIRLNEQATKRNVGGDVGEESVGFKYSSEHANLTQASDLFAAEDSIEQWTRCKRVALDYGVFIPADNN